MAALGDSRRTNDFWSGSGSRLPSNWRSPRRRFRIFIRSTSGHSRAASQTPFSSKAAAISRNAKLLPAIRAANSSTFTSTGSGGGSLAAMGGRNTDRATLAAGAFAVAGRAARSRCCVSSSNCRRAAKVTLCWCKSR